MSIYMQLANIIFAFSGKSKKLALYCIKFMNLVLNLKFFSKKT